MADSAQVAIEQVTNIPSDWSHLSLFECEGVPGAQVTGGVSSSTQNSSDALYVNVLERDADLRAEGPRRSLGSGTSLVSKPGFKSVVGAQIVANLGPLIDDGSIQALG